MSTRRCLKFRIRKKRDCTIRVAKTKALISFAVTAKLICGFVFTYAKSRFSHDEAHIYLQAKIYGAGSQQILQVSKRHEVNNGQHLGS